MPLPTARPLPPRSRRPPCTRRRSRLRRPPPPRRAAAAAALAVAATAACSGGDAGGGPQAGPEVVRDTVGDTLVVRTVSGSAWGAPARLVPEVSIGALEGDVAYLFGSIRSLGVGADGSIYVVDGQGPDLRVYDADGTYRTTFGRPGEGPGELKSPDGGLAVLSDGRILVRDPGNARIQVYAADGTALDAWPIRGGFNTGSPMYQDRRDHVYTQILLDPRADVRDWVIALVRIGPDGVPGDTLVPPDADYEAPAVEARRENSVSRSSVPFSPTESTALHPGGYFVHGLSTDYRLTLHRPGRPLRIERAYEPVPVAGGEKREAELRMTRNMRSNQPGWRWNGPPIPDTKPPFQNVRTGRDGRIWVQVSAEAVRREDPDYDPSDPDAVPNEWREPVAFDVFEDDGTYLGRVQAPEGFRTYPVPVFDGDTVWATTQDDLGVIRVVRYRLERAASADGG